MTGVNLSKLTDYVRHGRKRVQGWLSRVDAEIIETVIRAQNDAGIGGAVAEIGVHHGKCFIPLCLGLKDGERAYSIDIFDQQELNKDLSGRGDRDIFERNLTGFGVDISRVTIDPRSSLEVGPNDILGKVGAVRVFSIDGGHWLEVVENDLKLAEATISTGGVIVVDDFHRPEWPEVSAGYFKWFAERTKPIVPFAIGFNKLYLCEEGRAVFYKQKLDENAFLQKFVTRQSEFQGQEVPVYQLYLVPELGKRTVVKAVMMALAPELYAQIVKRRPRGAGQKS